MRLPNNQLYTFNDNIVFNGEQYPLSDKQAVLRGCTQDHCLGYGVVVYAGKETKLMMNTISGRHKVTKLEKSLNTKLLSVFIFMLVTTLICAGLGYKFEVEYIHTGRAFYFYQKYNHGNQVKAFFIIWLCHFVVINAMIPISLYVTLEVVRVFQALFVKADANLFDKIGRASCRERV